MEELFPPEFISGSVKKQRDLDELLAKYHDYSPWFIQVAAAWPEIRRWYEYWWPKVAPYLDKNFVSKLRMKKENSARAWEFELAVVMLEHGFELQERTGDFGPDLCIASADGKKIWIEGTTCDSGEVDPVPPRPVLIPGQIHLGGGDLETENRPRVLRITGAIGSKFEKYKKYLSNPKSGVSDKDSFIIAINGSDIEWASYSNILLKRAVFGQGPDVYVRSQSGGLAGPFYTSAPTITKKTANGEEVIPTNFMEADEFSGISAVLYCGHHAYACEGNGHKPGDCFLFAYHAKAKQPIPDQFFKFGIGIRKDLEALSISEKSQFDH